MPFLRTFTDKKAQRDDDEDDEKGVEPSKERRETQKLFRTGSLRLLVQTPGHDILASTESAFEENDSQRDVDQFEGAKVKMVDYDPSSCTLSKGIFEAISYQDPLIKMLKWRLQSDLAHSPMEIRFVSECESVESLVLDPPHDALRTIFYEFHGKSQRTLLSFNAVIKVFPNVKAIFVTSTKFTWRTCTHFIEFVRGFAAVLTLKKIYFSTKNAMRSDKRSERIIGSLQMRLREIGWEFVESQQMIRRMDRPMVFNL